MRAVLEMATKQRENDDVAILRREFQTHVEMVFKQFVVKTRAEKRRLAWL